jgi:regulator of sigma E protease
MAALQNIAYFIALLSVLIFAHELGHFLAAKALNVKVTRFSIGFGPRIFGFIRGETEYQVAWVPLGGYVKMAGEMGEDAAPGDEARGFLAQAPWKRAVIIGAGPLASLGFPVLLYLIVFLGFPQLSSRVMTLEPGMPAAQAGVRSGDLITSVDGTPVRTFDELTRAMMTRGGKNVVLGIDRDGQPVRVELVAERSEEEGPGKGRGRLGVSPQRRAPLLGVPAGSAAEKAGLRTFDRVVSVNGEPVPDQVALERRLDAVKGEVVQVEALRRVPANLPGVDVLLPERIHAAVARQPGGGLGALGAEASDAYVGQVVPGSAAAEASLAAGDRLIALDGQPLASVRQLVDRLAALGAAPVRLSWRHEGQERTAELRQKQVSAKDHYGRDVKALDLGLRPPFDWTEGEQLVSDRIRLGAGAAVVSAFRATGRTISLVGDGLLLLLTGQVPFSNLGGPILLYGVAAQSAQRGLDDFLSTMAFISVNLGLLNLLPIPVLDGFGLLSAFWEWIRRRPIPLRVREIANMFGLAMLVLLMIAVFKNDITRLLM